MELRAATKIVIEDFGQEVIKEPRFINILADYGVFTDSPSFKYVIKELINSGIMSKIVEDGIKRESFTNLVNKYTHQTTNTIPLREDIVKEVISKIIHALHPTRSDIFKFNDNGTVLLGCLEKNLRGIIEVPEGVISIPGEHQGFSFQENIVEVLLPTSLKNIASFCYCTSLSTVILPDELEYIESRTFEGCCSLTNIKLPPKIDTLRENTFKGCSSLKELHIPKTVIQIERDAFDCDVVVDQENPIYCSEDGCLYSSDKSILYRVPVNRYKIEFLKDTTSIESYAFSYCRKIKELIIPDTICVLKSRALYGCAGLERIEFSPTIVRFEGSPFYGCTAIKELNLPCFIKEIESAHELFRGMDNLERIICNMEDPFDTRFINRVRELTCKDTYMTRCTLCVPESSLSKYRNHPYWGQFLHIESFKASKTIISKAISFVDFFPVYGLVMGETTYDEIKLKWQLYDDCSNELSFLFNTEVKDELFDSVQLNGGYFTPDKWISLGLPYDYSKRIVSCQDILNLIQKWDATLIGEDKGNGKIAIGNKRKPTEELVYTAITKDKKLVFRFEFNLFSVQYGYKLINIIIQRASLSDIQSEPLKPSLTDIEDYAQRINSYQSKIISGIKGRLFKTLLHKGASSPNVLGIESTSIITGTDGYYLWFNDKGFLYLTGLVGVKYDEGRITIDSIACSETFKKIVHVNNQYVKTSVGWIYIHYTVEGWMVEFCKELNDGNITKIQIGY